MGFLQVGHGAFFDTDDTRAFNGPGIDTEQDVPLAIYVGVGKIDNCVYQFVVIQIPERVVKSQVRRWPWPFKQLF